MQIDDVIWLPRFIEKLDRKHRVATDEVEEVFANRPRFRFIDKGQRPGEDVYAATGQTNAGRYLVIYFILKPRHRALVVSARDMDRKERRRYAQK